MNEFLKANPDADRLGLVCFKPKALVVIASLSMIGWLAQLADVAKGLIYIHSQEMIHGDLKGVRFLRSR